MNFLYTESSSNIGGQELQALTQMDCLKRKGHSVLLACRKNSKIAIEASKKGIDVEFIPFRNSVHLLSIVKLLDVINSFNPQVLVCHSGHDSNIAGLSRMITGRKRFKIIRQKTYMTNKKGFFSLNYLSDHIIVPGNMMKYDLEKAGVKTPVTVIPPGFDFKKMQQDSSIPFPEDIQCWIDSDKDTPVIIQVGMLRGEKGHEFMLKLLFQLKKEGRKFRWLVVGGGHYENELAFNNMVDSLGMKNDVLVTGYLSPVTYAYKKASLLVVPSVNEPFGMTIVEASSFSVPVIASQTGGIPDIINDNQTGHLLPVHDFEAWLNTMRYFFDNPVFFKIMATRAKIDVENRFCITKTTDDIVRLCE